MKAETRRVMGCTVWKRPKDYRLVRYKEKLEKGDLWLNTTYGIWSTISDYQLGHIQAYSFDDEMIIIRKK